MGNNCYFYTYIYYSNMKKIFQVNILLKIMRMRLLSYRAEADLLIQIDQTKSITATNTQLPGEGWVGECK